MVTSGREQLDALPRLGWVDAPSPVERVDALAAEMGLASLWVKRDDALGLAHGLHGGTKVRKLDALLAAAPWKDAPAWASAGAIGSGHLVALAAAAQKLQRRLRAHLFWQPPRPEHLENLAFTATHATTLRFNATRVAMALRDPRMFVAAWMGDAAVVPPGATCLVGEMGVARGGLELAAQVADGVCPAPAHVLVPVGSSGTLVGLMVGLALAGLRCTVHGVVVVEHVFAPTSVLHARVRRLAASLGVAPDALPTLQLHRGALGPGYGVATGASLAACARAAREGLGLEPIYSGKAMVALQALAPTLRGDVLFWSTPRRAGPLPVADDWRARLPRALWKRLDEASQRRVRLRRRVFLGAGVAAAGLVVARTTGYAPPPAGLHLLNRASASLLAAAAEVVLAPTPTHAAIDDIVRRVDRYVATQPRSLRAQIEGAFLLVEQAPAALLGRWARFTSLSLADRARVLDALLGRHDVVAEAARAVRDFVMLGHYQRPESWNVLDYAGPWVSRDVRPDPYAALVARGAPRGFEAST